jgi:hypothetical protein
MAWTQPDSTPADHLRIIGQGCGERVHAIEYRWLSSMRTVRLYACRLQVTAFRPFGNPEPHLHAARWFALVPRSGYPRTSRDLSRVREPLAADAGCGLGGIALSDDHNEAGRVRVEQVATDVGCSRQRLWSRFRSQIGSPPSTPRSWCVPTIRPRWRWSAGYVD